MPQQTNLIRDRPALDNIRLEYSQYKNVRCLMRYLTREALIEKHKEMRKTKANGVDKVTKKEYGEKLEINIEKLLKKIQNNSYSPLPIRRLYIPKDNGKKRPLGIPAYEDKLVQGVLADILNQIYEPIFLDCSYRF